MLQRPNRYHSELSWAHLPPFWRLLYSLDFRVLLFFLLEVRIDAVICAKSLFRHLSRVLEALKWLVY